MRAFVLSHFSALWWFLSHRDPRVDSNAPNLVIPKSADAPDVLLAEQLRWSIGLDGPLDFLVLGDGAFRRSASVRPHGCTQDLPSGSLIPIACHARDAELFVCSPELAFLQICQIVDTTEAIYFGMCACSDFRFDPFAQGGVVYRAEGLHSIASLRSMGRFWIARRGSGASSGHVRPWCTSASMRGLQKSVLWECSSVFHLGSAVLIWGSFPLTRGCESSMGAIDGAGRNA